MALTTDSSVLTGIGKGYGEPVFERQVLGVGPPGGVFEGMSTSGRSTNIVAAMEAARRTRLSVVGFTGRADGETALASDPCFLCP